MQAMDGQMVFINHVIMGYVKLVQQNWEGEIFPPQYDYYPTTWFNLCSCHVELYIF